MTAESLPTSALRASVRMTPKEDTEGVVIKLKVFWKTTRVWTDSDISDYHKNAMEIMRSLAKERYWDKEGNLQGSKFTCEDFAVRVLCVFASQRGLPVCLVTEAATYRNMELYKPEVHDQYSSNPWGFARMAMSTYGAPDMLKNASKVEGGLKRGLGWLADRLLFFRINPSQNPDADLYLGQLAQHGVYILERDGRWSYRNTTLKRKKEYETYHSQGIHLRWNFDQFSK